MRARNPTHVKSSTSSARPEERGVALPGDLRDESFCRKLVADAVAALVGLDILVLDAGRQQTHASILDISTDQFDWTMKTTIYAPFWIIKAALLHLQPGSAIIGTTSEQAYDPWPDPANPLSWPG
jgi:NAD(P)-dependent dehydrogenase (short-subunit alcohol dehydrogenase family)